MRIIAKKKHLKMEPGGEYNVTSVEGRALVALGIARKAPLASVVVSRNIKPAIAAKAPDAPKRAYTRRDMVAEPAGYSKPVEPEYAPSHFVGQGKAKDDGKKA
jgi:hypothetical protein